MASQARKRRDDDEDRATLDIVAHLLTVEPAFSRNKHFEAYRDPQFKRALALTRRIKALAADVDAALDAPADKGMTVRVTDGVWAGEPAHQVRIEGPGLRRLSWFSPAAYALLLRACPRLEKT